MNKIKGFINLIRFYPVFSTFVVSTSMIITSTVLNHPNINFYYNIDSLFWFVLKNVFLASLPLTMATAGSNILNQITDLDEDHITKSYRPLPQGIFSIKEASIFALFFYLLSFFISLLFGFYFILFTFLFIVFTVSYSIYPRIKRFLVLNQLWIGVARGFFIILGSWSISGYPFDDVPLALGLISCIFLLGGMSSKDIADRDADRKTGINTIVNFIGLKRASYFSLFCMVFAYLLVIPLFFLGVFSFYHLPLVFFVVFSFLIFFQMNQEKFDSFLFFENVSAWFCVHASNFLFIFCFMVLTLIGVFIL